jgi:hypothetical protein
MVEKMMKRSYPGFRFILTELGARTISMLLGQKLGMSEMTSNPNPDLGYRLCERSEAPIKRRLSREKIFPIARAWQFSCKRSVECTAFLGLSLSSSSPLPTFSFKEVSALAAPSTHQDQGRGVEKNPVFEERL